MEHVAFLPRFAIVSADLNRGLAAYSERVLTMKWECGVGGLKFSNPLVYGGGTCKTLEDVRKASASAASGLELGTITPLSKPGNQGKVFIAKWGKSGDLLYTLNSLGLPNPGRDVVNSWAKEAIKIAHDAGKLIGINVAADAVDEIVQMLLWALKLGFDWVTINAGCPNKWKEVNGQQVPQAILSFDTGDTEALMERLERRVGSVSTPVWWKPSPDNDTLGRFVNHAQIIGQCSTITAWIANNTVPHCYGLDDDGNPITPGGGLAGMGGPAVKPKALGDIIRLHRLLPERFDIVGAGGVTHGEDIVEFLDRGARIVQFTSTFWVNGMNHGVAGEMLGRFVDLPEAQKYASV
jgi:dihydroorotate dehydrogenase (fumarate)